VNGIGSIKTNHVIKSASYKLNLGKQDLWYGGLHTPVLWILYKHPFRATRTHSSFAKKKKKKKKCRVWLMGDGVMGDG